MVVNLINPIVIIASYLLEYYSGVIIYIYAIWLALQISSTNQNSQKQSNFILEFFLISDGPGVNVSKEFQYC